MSNSSCLQRPPFFSPRQAIADLLKVVQELSLARDMDTIMRIVRSAARHLSGADGASFVLRDNDMCHYVDEDAIAPLWKGSRFPMDICLGGWAMRHQEAVVIEDVYADKRVPVEAYRTTFVKSMVMTPIRIQDPIGAIGIYWADHHRASPEEVELLQALANSTSIAIENVQIYTSLEERVRRRTQQLEIANRELEAFSAAVSHDLRAPLRAIAGFSKALLEDCGGGLDASGRHHLDHILHATDRMGHLIESLLSLSRVTAAPVNRSRVNLSRLAHEIHAELQNEESGHEVMVEITENVFAHGDSALLYIIMENLLGNAWKYSAKQARPAIRFGLKQDSGGSRIYFVQDNGAGFDPKYADKLFTPFGRLHSTQEFAGTGIGLATVQRIVHKHNGRIWAESTPEHGASFFFTLGE